MVADTGFYHEPVLLQECLSGLNIRPNGIYVDCTMGGGGHFSAIAQKLSAEGTALGIDRDDAAHAWVRARLPETGARIILAKAPFSQLSTVLEREGIAAIDGVLFDLGVSSHQFDEASRGFTYRADAPLDMRMDRSTGLTAAELIAISDEQALAAILGGYGDVIGPLKMARLIKAGGAIETSGQLVRVLEKAYGKEISYKVLSKIFQALRIAVNGELDELKVVLAAATNALALGGRLVVMSYHSLEDRIVKNFLRDNEGGCVCPPEQPFCSCNNPPLLKRITRKAIEATHEEISHNSRARSAKLRIAEKV